MTITELIKSERSHWRELERHNRMQCGSWLMHEFLLRNGRPFSGRALPAAYSLMRIKGCYENCRQLALEEGLRYWEGFTTWKEDFRLHGLLIAHAWCVDEDGGVVDPTLSTEGRSAAGEHDYYGVEFSLTELERSWDGAMLTGMNEAYRLKIMIARDPGFGEIARPFKLRLK